MSKNNSTLEERFWSKVDIQGPDDCWLWKACSIPKGYGWFSIGGKGFRAHRISWELINGPIPNGLQALHNCPTGDNPACVNPAHLWLGTNQDNMDDKKRKGRCSRLFGENNGIRKHPEKIVRGEQQGNAKLLSKNVIEIREKYILGISLIQLAKIYNVKTNTIWDIVHRRTWKHLK